MSRFIKASFFVIILAIQVISLQAQNKDELEKQKQQLKKDIEYKNKLLKETKKNKQLSLNQLVILNKKISMRQELIRTINRQLTLLNKQIEEKNQLIASLEDDLEKLKSEYAQMILSAYKNKGAYERLMFVFAAEDFNQAYKRLKYYQQYAEYRQRQAEMIQKTQEALNLKIKDLNLKKVEKQNLLVNENTEKQQLSSEKEEQQNAFKGLQKKEKDLKKEIERKEKEANKLQKAIERIIEEEIRKKGKNFFVMTPEARELSANFTSNKGKLPWPVIKGVITEAFGEHAHPILKQVKVKNNGVNISTGKGEKARAVFDGEVSRVIIITGAGKAVMVRHGEFISIYSNLREVYVKTGDEVKTKQEIGEIIHDEGYGKTELHFEIWKGKTILNPSDWLYKAN